MWKPDIVLHNKWVVIQSFPTFNSFPQTPLSGLRVKDGKRKGKSPQNSWNKILGSDRWVPIWTVRSSLKSNFSWVSKDIHICIDLLRHALWLVQKIAPPPQPVRSKGKPVAYKRIPDTADWRLLLHSFTLGCIYATQIKSAPLHYASEQFPNRIFSYIGNEIAHSVLHFCPKCQWRRRPWRAVSVRHKDHRQQWRYSHVVVPKSHQKFVQNQRQVFPLGHTDMLPQIRLMDFQWLQTWPGFLRRKTWCGLEYFHTKWWVGSVVSGRDEERGLLWMLRGTLSRPHVRDKNKAAYLVLREQLDYAVHRPSPSHSNSVPLSASNGRENISYDHHSTWYDCFYDRSDWSHTVYVRGDSSYKYLLLCSYDRDFPGSPVHLH